MRHFEIIVALLLGTPAAQGGAALKATPFVVKTVQVAPFTIEPQTLDGARMRLDQARILVRLSEAATDRVVRSVDQGRLHTYSNTATPILLSGVVRLPVALPECLDHHRARTRGEPFVTAVVALTGADGAVIAWGEAALRWKDLRWTDHHWRGGGRTRRLHHHDRPVDDVLEQAVSEAVDRAVKRLTADAKSNWTLIPLQSPGCP